MECSRPLLIQLLPGPLDWMVYRAPPPPPPRLVAASRTKDFPSFFRPSKKLLHGPLRWPPEPISLENDAQMVPRMMLKWSQSVVPRAMIFQNGQYAIRTRRRSPNQCFRTPEWHTFCTNILPNLIKKQAPNQDIKKTAKIHPGASKNESRVENVRKSTPQPRAREPTFRGFFRGGCPLPPLAVSRVRFSMIFDGLDLIFHHSCLPLGPVFQ